MRRAAFVAAVAAACLLALCAWGCEPKAKESWTVSIYMCGSDLETKHARGTNALEELKSANIPENVSVVVQTGGARSWRIDEVKAGAPQRFLVRNGQLQELAAPEARSMGSVDSLAGFLAFCGQEYPSDRSMVVLWNHGGGPLKGVCFDETSSYDVLSLDDLDQAFAQARQLREGAPYDIIGMDACLMGSLEVASVLADDAAYMVASEEIEPGAGWDYAHLMEALAVADSPSEVAASVCEGYQQKSIDAGKGSAITLSAIDLGAVPALEDALDAAIQELRPDGADERVALQRMAYASRKAESFGGATDAEGESNLVDLAGLAQAASDTYSSSENAFSKLSQAVQASILKNASGEASSGAQGLSIYYPLVLDQAKLHEYCSITPLESYAQALEAMFAVRSLDITFTDPGSVNEEGAFAITVSPETMPNVDDVYAVTRCVEGEPYIEKSIDMVDDWESGTFSRMPDDFCNTLDGMALDVSMIDYGDDYIMYSAPVMLNGQKTNLRFSELYDPDDEDALPRYEILGTWNGIDHVTGLSDRSLASFAEGDVIGAVSATDQRVRDEVIFADDSAIGEAPLSPGTYETWFVVVDLYGQRHRSATHTFQIAG